LSSTNKPIESKNWSVAAATGFVFWPFRPPTRKVVNVSILQSPSEARLPDSRRAWVMVLVAFTVGFVVFGTMYSFGAFFAPIAGEFRASRAATSAFFSITGLMFYLAGSVAGHFGDQFGPAVMTALGAAVMGGGLGLTGFIGQMWEGCLTYGIGIGVGAACAYRPILAILGGWFTRQRNAALGAAAAGCGMLVVPPLSPALIERFGWRVTAMKVGVGCAVLLALAAMLVRLPPPRAAGVHRHLGGIVRSFEFLMLYASWALATIALFVPFVFLPAYVAMAGARWRGRHCCRYWAG
jgi:MFS family permease